jgi:Domain of Unknown Function (DUF1080)
MMSFIPLVSVALLAALQPAVPSSSAPNVLTSAEQADGWQLLFDGKTLDAWRGYRLPGLPESGWHVENGTLRTVAKVRGGDIITRKQFGDFEFTWDWRVIPGGNNGVKYFVTEERPKAPGHEYQMIDDSGYPGKLGPNQRTGDFYDVLPAAPEKPLRPAGEWNTSRIVVRGTRVQHWLNGVNVLTYELGSPAVTAGIGKSKFKGEPDFGKKVAGHIMLTYHQDECWYRNLKIRELR